MPHKNPALDRTGHSQNFPTRIAANLNFCKRMMLGFIANNAIHHNHLWIKRHEEYTTALTPERQTQLLVIEAKVADAKKAALEVVEAIKVYYNLPKVEQPKRARQRIARKRQLASKGDENFQEG